MRLLFSIVFCFIINLGAYSQEILWEYTVEDGKQSIPWGMNMGDDDDFYINISNPDPPLANGNLSAYSHVYLLNLDLAGDYKSSLYVKGCKNRTSLRPFGRNRFLSYGNNCIKGKVGRFSYDSRLFNKRGKLKKIGEALPGRKFATHADTNKVTFFSKELGFYRGTTIYHGVLNKRLKLSMDSMDVKELQREGYGLSMGPAHPMPLGENSWVFSYQHGIVYERNRNSMRAYSGGFAVVKNGKVVKQYYPERTSYFISELSADGGEVCALYRNRNRSDNTFLFIGEDGEITNEFCVDLKRSERVRVLKYANGMVNILTDQSILKFDTLGIERLNFMFPPGTFDYVQGLMVLEDGEYIATGSKDEKVKIIKIGRSDTTPGGNQILFANIETVPAEVAAVSLYPNPAANSLNIEITYAEKEINDLCDIMIYDFNGVLAKKTNGRLPSISVRIDDLKSGTYAYRILSETGEVFTGKFIKI
jgi:hypothetical protein